MDDFAMDDFSEPEEVSSPTDSVPDLADDDTNPEAVLPPMDTDLVEDTSRQIGKPEELSEYWKFQQGPNDCALYAQGGILAADGQTFDIEKYREQGTEGGWYTYEGGTYVDHMGDLLEENGVSVTHYENATFQDMASELEQGHGVVAAVDCLPIWGEPGGHALWVTGMEVDPDGVPSSVICNDSGRPDGESFHYPYEDFKQAWDSFGNTMVATKDEITQ